ncbi:centrosomal protein of 126 kDa isoform X2 [Numida meleagris]|nr:centrosomal protein of 126 kDa isoform X2 [Numida meleagris]XP_021236853.1 centrosomal protein of 126 kDa isoform X2 [Numida meleagris]XP_021236859.1 centrosomal protein of 126 kDa isoform X2 [Numida meleagris]
MPPRRSEAQPRRLRANRRSLGRPLGSSPPPRPVAKEAASPVATMAAVRPQERPVPRTAVPGRCTEPGGTGGEALWRRHLQRPEGRGAGADLCADRALTLPLGWNLEEERWALREDQKLCRSRARKYLIETNRRRRAFEERQKQREEKEQRFREQVLQQRKIKFRETTEKFQRAHLPASQYKQIVQKKAAFQLEEALEQIKGSVLASGLCLPSRNKTTFRTTDDTSYSSASRNGYSHQEQISAMVGLDKTVRESSRTSVDSNQLLFQKNLKEMQQLLEKQHLSNLENFHKEVKRTDDSESLSSLDSLEAGEQNGNYTPSSESSLTTTCDCAPYIPGKSQIRSNDMFYAAENTSKNMHLNNCQRNLDSQNNHNDLPTEDLLAKRNVLTLAEHTNNTEEESSVSHRSGIKVAEFSTSGNQESSVNKAFPLLQNIKEERNNSSSGVASTLATGHSVFSPIKAWASPDSIPGERVQDLTQNQSFKMTPQKRSKSVQTSTEPIATSRILFPNQRCFSGISSPADVLPKDRNVSTDFLKNTLGKVSETKEENIKSIDDIDQGSSLFQDIPNASALCNVKKQNNKEEEKANAVETMSFVSDTELGFGTPAQHNSQKNIYDRKRAKLVRGILKKEAKAVVMNHGIFFGTRPVSSIRDSLELAKSQKKSAENTKNSRKLKWCDQINQIIAENDESWYEESTNEISSAQLYCVQTVSNAPCANSCMGAHPSNTMFTENHHENSHISRPNANSAKSNKECTPLNMFMSPGSSFPKKVWMISKHEESKSPESSNNDKIHEGNQHKNKAKITRRPRPIRDQLFSVPRSSRGTGTVLRLQSATESRAAQGRMLAPQPPSAPALGSKRGKTRASPAARQPLPSSHPQDTTTHGNSLNERQALLADQILNKSTQGSSESITCSSEVATVLFTPRCRTSCELLAKHTGSVSSGPTTGCQQCSVTCTEQRANTENRLHLDHIPTAEEKAVWKGARIALTPKDPAAGVIQHHMSHYNNSHKTECQPCKAPVSRIPAGDSSQKTCFKASSRMNKLGFFHANSSVPVTKQRQIFNNSENKHRAFTEQRRQTVASKRWKPTYHVQNSLHNVQLRPVQSAFDPAQNTNNTYRPDEVSESTAQFLVAEKLISTAAAEDEILAAMGSVQPARQPLLLNTAPHLGMSALSIEEEKIFQSLDHLNQRLQNVQEAITRNPSASRVLQTITPF